MGNVGTVLSPEDAQAPFSGEVSDARPAQFFEHTQNPVGLRFLNLKKPENPVGPKFS